MSIAWPLIGRGAMLARAEALLDRGSGGVVLVGDAGIGKSRIASEIVRLGADRGFATARTVGTLAAAEIPLGALSHLLPELRVSGARAMAAAQSALTTRAAGRPLLLMLDDAHLLDNHSAALILQLALTMPTFIVATIRAGEAVPDPVVTLWKDGLAERVEVGPLPDESIEQFVGLLLGGEVAPELTRLIVTRADGNPLVARELSLAGLDSGAIAAVDDRWTLVGELGLSARLQELVAVRVAGLSSGAHEALELVAFGEPLELRVGQELGSGSSLIELERRGLVVLREDGRRRQLWLSHPYYADFARATVGRLLAATIKGRLARATRAAGMRRRTDLVRVATWQLEAGVGEPELLTAAAQETYHAGDMAGTARLAAGAWDIRPTANSGFLLGTSVGFSGRHAEADAVLAAATALADNDSDYARLVLAHSSVISAGLSSPDAAIHLLATADARLSDPDARAMVRAQRAHLLAFRGEVDEPLSLAEPILADASGPPAVVAAMAAMIAYGLSGAYRAAVDLAAQILPHHRETWAAGTVAIPPELLELLARGARVAMGELTAAAPEEALRAPSVRVDASRPVVVLRAIHAAIAALLRGRPAGADAILTRVAVLPSDPLASTAESLGATASALRGRRDEAASRLARAEAARQRESRSYSTGFDEARIWCLVAAAEPGRARGAASRAIADDIRSHRWAPALERAHDLARLGAAREAATASSQIGERVDGPLASARLAHIAGLHGNDADKLDEASVAFARMGAELFAAEATAAAANVARRAGERRRAIRLFRRAIELASRCEGARTPALFLVDAPEPLSPREREIAVLAATGLPSDAIARRLFLSIRTVDNHLQHVYQKLGITSRSELATAMGDRGDMG